MPGSSAIYGSRAMYRLPAALVACAPGAAVGARPGRHQRDRALALLPSQRMEHSSTGRPWSRFSRDSPIHTDRSRRVPVRPGRIRSTDQARCAYLP